MLLTQAPNHALFTDFSNVILLALAKYYAKLGVLISPTNHDQLLLAEPALPYPEQAAIGLAITDRPSRSTLIDYRPVTTPITYSNLKFHI